MSTTNRALVFIKPEAVTESAVRFIKQYLSEQAIVIQATGELTAELIDRERIIDRHYFAISRSGYFEIPEQLFLDQAAQQKFLTSFGMDWQKALADHKVINSRQALGKYQESDGLQKSWARARVSSKIASGIYMAYLEDIDLIVINGFYPAMRDKFTQPGSKVLWLDCAFESSSLSWKMFRAEVIGSTDPQKAAQGSLRSLLYHDHQKYSIQQQPSTSANGVHASAGPLEGLRERMVWLGQDAEDDDFGRVLIDGGIDQQKLLKLLEDPMISYQGREQKLFDLTEDLDAGSVVQLISEINITE